MPSVHGLVLASEVLDTTRGFLSDMDATGSGRWTDSRLLNFIDRANKRIVGDVLFPDARLTTLSKPNVQEYQIPLLLRPDRCYVAGQIATRTDTNTLEGRQIGLNDPGLSSTAAPGAGSGGPPGTLGAYAPAWSVQSPLSYPVGNTWGFPAPDAQPWDSSESPRYYLRGGYLGLVAAPANLTPVTICLDGVFQPPTITATTDELYSPENFVDAIAWAACAIAKFADDGSRADAQRQVAEQNYDRERKKLRQWRGDLSDDERRGPKVNVLRPAHSRFQRRSSR